MQAKESSSGSEVVPARNHDFYERTSYIGVCQDKVGEFKSLTMQALSRTRHYSVVKLLCGRIHISLESKCDKPFTVRLHHLTLVPKRGYKQRPRQYAVHIEPVLNNAELANYENMASFLSFQSTTEVFYLNTNPFQCLTRCYFSCPPVPHQRERQRSHIRTKQLKRSLKSAPKRLVSQILLTTAVRIFYHTHLVDIARPFWTV